jgi:hypothetical protein
MIKNILTKTNKFALIGSTLLTTGLVSSKYFASVNCKDKIDILVVGATG